MSEYKGINSYAYEGPTDIDPNWPLHRLPTVNISFTQTLDPTVPIPYAKTTAPVQVINFVGGGLTLTLKTTNLTNGFTLYLFGTGGISASTVVLDNGANIGSASSLSVPPNHIIQWNGSAFTLVQ